MEMLWLHCGFYTPAVMCGIFAGRYCEYSDNTLESRHNLWEFLTFGSWVWLEYD